MRAPFQETVPFLEENEMMGEPENFGKQQPPAAANPAGSPKKQVI
jgi:hypothetical protein